MTLCFQRLPTACSKTKARGGINHIVAALLGATALTPLACGYAHAQTTASILNLSTLDPNFPIAYAHGISADGLIVVGDGPVNGSFAGLVWSQAGGFKNIGVLPTNNNVSSSASAISADGTVVVGISATSAFMQGQPVRWTQSGGLVALGFIGGGGARPDGRANAASRDGGVIVGSTTNASNLTEAFRWQNNAIVGLGFLGGTGVNRRSDANGVNGDGSVIVGASSSSSSSFEAYRWTQAGGMQALGFLGAEKISSATAVTPDGLVVVGYSGQQTEQAFRWTQAGGMAGLGLLSTAGSFNSSRAAAVSADGSIIVGSASSPNAAFMAGEAFRWTQASGIKSLTGLLTGAGVALGNGDHLESAEGVSANGQIIVGTLSNDDGSKRNAYVVRYIDGTVPPVTDPVVVPPVPLPPTPPVIAGITTPGSVQTSVDALERNRQGLMTQQEGFVAALLGDNSSIGGGGSDAGAFASAGSAAGGTAGRVNFGNGFSLFGGLSVAAEDYTRMRMRNVVTLAGAGRYVFPISAQASLFGEIGGWFSPSGRYRFERLYANGAGTAIGVGNTSGTQTYFFGRLGAAFNATKDDEIAASFELGRQSFHTRGDIEQIQVNNPFNAAVPGATDTMSVGKARLQWTHNFSAEIDTTIWAGIAHGFNAHTSLTAIVPGFGQIATTARSQTWAEFGARIGYHATDHITLDLFADGVSGGKGTGTRVHVGGGVKARF